MNSMILYLTESAGSLLVFYMVYWLFLRRDTFFMMNRVYLLGMVLFSMLVPMLPLRLLPVAGVPDMMVMLEPILVSPEKAENFTSGNLQWIEIASVVYLTGVIIFTIRFLVQLLQIWFITRRFGIRRSSEMRLVYVDRGYSPFSFFNLIFINEKEIPDDALETILAHERVHISQAHTFDLLLVELMIILQWFNPVAWFIGRDLKSIHEFLADEGVLRSGVDRIGYQEMILNETMGIQVNNLANNFNVSLLKKRIMMMTKIRSSLWRRIKFLLVLPVLVVVVSILSANTIKVVPVKTGDLTGLAKSQEKKPVQSLENSDTAVYTVVEKLPSFPGGGDACVKFIKKNIKYPEEALKKDIRGTVYVTFVVMTDGTVSNVKILRGIGGGCDEEAIRVLKMMPKWTPGEQKGKKVNVAFNLPIKFNTQLKFAPVPDDLKKK
ncbi:MAG: M56 family metallopeptidase [bacterium]